MDDSSCGRKSQKTVLPGLSLAMEDALAELGRCWRQAELLREAELLRAAVARAIDTGVSETLSASLLQAQAELNVAILTALTTHDAERGVLPDWVLA